MQRASYQLFFVALQGGYAPRTLGNLKQHSSSMYAVAQIHTTSTYWPTGLPLLVLVSGLPGATDYVHKRRNASRRAVESAQN